MEKIPPYKGDENKTSEERQKEAREYFMGLMGEPLDASDKAVLKHIDEEHKEFSLEGHKTPKAEEVMHGAAVSDGEYASNLDAIEGFVDGEKTHEARKLVSERPDFGPRQVRLPEELQEGETYLIHGHKKTAEMITILESPFVRENGRMFVKARHVSGSHNSDMGEYNLALIGIIPYQTSRGALWSATYWVEHIK